MWVSGALEGDGGGLHNVVKHGEFVGDFANQV